MKYLTFDIYNGAGTVSAETELFDNKEFNDKGVFLKVNELIISDDLIVLSFIGKRDSKFYCNAPKFETKKN